MNTTPISSEKIVKFPHQPRHNASNCGIIAVAIGAILSLGGLFLILAAYQVLPIGMNSISNLGSWGQAIGYSVLVIGILLIAGKAGEKISAEIKKKENTVKVEEDLASDQKHPNKEDVEANKPKEIELKAKQLADLKQEACELEAAIKMVKAKNEEKRAAQKLEVKKLDEKIKLDKANLEANYPLELADAKKGEEERIEVIKNEEMSKLKTEHENKLEILKLMVAELTNEYNKVKVEIAARFEELRKDQRDKRLTLSKEKMNAKTKLNNEYENRLIGAQMREKEKIESAQKIEESALKNKYIEARKNQTALVLASLDVNQRNEEEQLRRKYILELDAARSLTIADFEKEKKENEKKLTEYDTKLEAQRNEEKRIEQNIKEEEDKLDAEYKTKLADQQAAEENVNAQNRKEITNIQKKYEEMRTAAQKDVEGKIKAKNQEAKNKLDLEYKDKLADLNHKASEVETAIKEEENRLKDGKEKELTDLKSKIEKLDTEIVDIPEQVAKTLNLLLEGVGGIDNLPYFSKKFSTIPAYTEMESPIMKGWIQDPHNASRKKPFIAIKMHCINSKQEIGKKLELEDNVAGRSAYANEVVLLCPKDENFLLSWEQFPQQQQPHPSFFNRIFTSETSGAVTKDQATNFSLLQKVIRNGKGTDNLGLKWIIPKLKN